MGQSRWLRRGCQCSFGSSQDECQALRANPKPMKISAKKFNLPVCLLIILAILFTNVACSKKDFVTGEVKHQQEDRFPSASFNHFENGLLFTDVEVGLGILWEASFKGGSAYKENLGFFVNGGLLILPNKNNTCRAAVLSALQLMTDGGKLYVKFAGNFIEVLGIIHTHPDYSSLPEPSPRNDYQYGFLGIHNYIMDRGNLFDAYKDTEGNEVFRRLGPRSAYHMIPLNESQIVSEQYVAVAE